MCVCSCDKVEHMHMAPLCGVHDLNKISDGMIISINMLKSATLLSATPKMGSEGGVPLLFFQKERCGSGTPFFAKER